MYIHLIKEISNDECKGIYSFVSDRRQSVRSAGRKENSVNPRGPRKKICKYIFVYTYQSIEALISSPERGERYAGAMSNTVLAPVLPSFASL